MEQNDYYQTLGVPYDATSEQIKTSYRKLALKYHPDRNNGSTEAADRMKALNEAYAVLSDSKKREDYDFMRRRFGSSAHNRFRQSYSEQDIFSGSDILSIFNELTKSFGLRGFEEIFKDAQGYHSFEFGGPSFSGRGYVFVGKFGSAESRKRPELPPIRSGIGKIGRMVIEKIAGIKLPVEGKDITDSVYITPQQAQNGASVEYTVKKRNKKVMIRIPKGVKEGQQLRLTGMGEEGTAGGDAGNLYLRIQIKKPLLTEIRKFISGLTK